jgi:hypothetical protein
MNEGTFLVTEADGDTAVLRNVSDGQVHTLAENPGIEAGMVVDATLAAEPPMAVAWSIVDLDREFSIEVGHSTEPPTQRSRETAAAQSVGEVARHERAGTGEVHVLTVPPERTDEAVSDVLDDEATRERAARLGVERVEVRSEEGVVSVRYLP